MIVKSREDVRKYIDFVRDESRACCDKMASALAQNGYAGTLAICRPDNELWQIGLYGRGATGQEFIPLKMCPWCGEKIESKMI